MNCIEVDNVIDFNQNRKLKMSQEMIENLIAQVEAGKQMYNESLNSLYAVRTHNVMLQRQMQNINTRLSELEGFKSAEVNPTPITDVPAPEVCEDHHAACQEPAPILENLSA